jgi:hypothetical protein
MKLKPKPTNKRIHKTDKPHQNCLKEQPVEVEAKANLMIFVSKSQRDKKSFKFEKIGKKPPINEIDIFMDCVYILCKKENTKVYFQTNKFTGSGEIPL